MSLERSDIPIIFVTSGIDMGSNDDPIHYLKSYYSHLANSYKLSNFTIFESTCESSLFKHASSYEIVSECVKRFIQGPFSNLDMAQNYISKQFGNENIL